MSPNFRLFHVSNLSVRNFLIFLLMYTGSVDPSSLRPEQVEQHVPVLVQRWHGALVTHELVAEHQVDAEEQADTVMTVGHRSVHRFLSAKDKHRQWIKGRPGHGSLKFTPLL